MSSRHQPTAGADSEPQFDPGATYDNVCDRCSRSVFGYEHLYAALFDTKLMWLCPPCFERHSDWFGGEAA